MSSYAESLEKVFPIVDNSAIRYGDKFTVRIPKCKLNETTRVLKLEIANQENVDQEEKRKREQYIESVVNEKLRKSYLGEGDSNEHIEELKRKIKQELSAGITTEDGKHVLSHLSPYVEEPFAILDSYFSAQHLERLVRHQIESYNHFVNYQIWRTIQMFNDGINIKSDKHYIPEKDLYTLETSISFENFKMFPPQIHENNGATKIMLPQEAKLRNFTYASSMAIDVKVRYTIRDGENLNVPRIIEKVLPKINIGKMPIMLKSTNCVLTQNKHVQSIHTGECPMDCGGYFIIKGSEKTVLGQERAAENRIYCFDGKNTTKWSWFAEIKSVPDYKCISPKQVDMMIASKNNGFGHGIYVTIPRFKQPIELFALFRALGVPSDREICEYILLNLDDPKQKELLECLQASIIDGNKYICQEDAIKHIVSMAAFTPINMDKETGAKKKREFALEVLNTDLLPHCKTLPQKLFLLGTMAKKLLQTSLGWIPPDDRDSYLNKRIELTGTLLNNLFRNYFNKLVKEMQKKIMSEINTGSWRASDDYENIVNMTNIYKIMKSTTIENGINRALATGDFSIKQSNSSKVGVAQVLNRLTYVASLSHLRRINTPLEKSGELIDPRKLHNTTWGFLCPAETPEGQSIGVVKNISYMSHITIPTNSSSLYEYVDQAILKVDEASPKDLYDKVKVFVNGTWLGVTDTPMELYTELKDKKCRGIINIYTSVIFDYKNMEIRVCNDGGRLTRPVLRVKNNRAIITPDIIKKIASKELSWNDLLTNCRIPESVIEYIDPEEQNFAMIAMKSKNAYLQDPSLKIQYTHCEIHPSTIFGVLASCIPFPEHNQAPRNTYQCLHPDTMVWMADLTQKQIKDVKVGESVFTFDPDTLNMSITNVTNQFVHESTHQIYKLTTISGREIIATEDHRFMTSDGWKTVEDMIACSSIKIGVTTNNRCISLPNTKSFNCILSTDEFVAKMRELEVEETKNRKINKIFKYVNQLSDIGLLPLMENNPTLAIISRIIGFVNSDGMLNIYEKTVSGQNTKVLQCGVDFATYEDAIEFQYDLSLCGFELSNKIMDGTRQFTRKEDGRTQTRHTYTILYAGAFPAFLISIGAMFGKKTETARLPIPDWIVSNAEYSRQYLKGLQGGDGCKITWDKPTTQYYCRISMHGTTQQIRPDLKDSLIHYMNQCVDMLTRLNIEAYVFPEKSYSGNRTICGFQVRQSEENLVNYYNAIGYAYSKHKTLHSFKTIEYLRSKFINKNAHSTKYINTSEWMSREIEEKNTCVFESVLSITKEPPGLVSCIETESSNHSFIAGQGFLSHNCAMSKQSIGIYSTNFDQRMDKTAYILTYPSRPLVDTRLMNFIKLNQIPSGQQIHVAIMTHTGYNQEDSVLINKGSIDRGLFMATIYHTEKDEDNNIVRDEIIRCKPNKQKTKGIKYGNYEKLNSQGFIPENTKVENRDIIIAKIIPIKENRNDPTKTIKYEDQSKTFRTHEDTYIDKNYTGRNGDGYNFAKVRVRTLRKPVLGDKFSSRHGQKGTCGNIIPECDMPFTKDGLKPDIIINPHAIPSRMTIAQLKETLLGKVLIELGIFGDGTSFGNLDIKTIAQELQKTGYESYGNEIMYDGLSGEQMETAIFIGPVFYQRLKHMVNDKQHSRAIGPMVNLTRQPAEGRSRDGGFRIGEMERDVMLAHGMASFCKERLYDVSDKYSAYVCRKCGMLAAYNDGKKGGTADFTVHKCNTCDNMTDFAKVDIPYAYKLLSQELQTINVVPRLMVE
jgi:DNA-directed RNA polymerase beta subunit